MPINMVEEDSRMKVIGKIRLGITKTSARGAEYPSNVDYFVLKDAPDVENYYGKDPTEIHGFFLVDERDLVVPTWLRLYGAGVKQADGTRTPGKMRCYGEGPYKDGRPGRAWHMEAKDPDTGLVPERQCLGPKCKDWNDSRGNNQCKWTMQVLLFMPHCNPTGLYQIDTTSKTTIFRFHAALKTMAATNSGRIKGYPFRLWRDTVPLSPPGETKKVAQHVMDIEAFPAFANQYGDINTKIEGLNKTNILLPSEQEMLEGGMEDNYRALPVGQSDQGALPGASQDRMAQVDQILQDPAVISLFKSYEEVLGQSISVKARRQAVMKKINEPDMLGAVIATLKEKVNAPGQGQQSAPAPAQAAQPATAPQPATEPAPAAQPAAAPQPGPAAAQAGAPATPVDAEVMPPATSQKKKTTTSKKKKTAAKASPKEETIDAGGIL